MLLMEEDRSGLMCFFLPIHDLGMCSGACDQGQEELAIHFGHVVAIYRLACGMVDGRTVHNWTAYKVLLALVLGNVLGRLRNRKWGRGGRRERAGKGKRKRLRSEPGHCQQWES